MITSVEYDNDIGNVILNDCIIIVGLNDFIKGDPRLMFDKSLITRQEAEEVVFAFASEFFAKVTTRLKEQE